MTASERKELQSLLRELCLPVVRRRHLEAAREAGKEDLAYEAYLLGLCREEAEVRRQNRIERLLKESRLPREKSLPALDTKRLGRPVTLQVKSLVTGGFLDRRENVLVFGNPGSGKTHLVCAVGQELVLLGRRLYFTSCALLVQELLRAKQELRLEKVLKRLSRYEGLILDDIGYVEHSREEMEVLFTLFAERYERGSVLVTSNLPFSGWERIFKDPMTTAAAIDRLVHHSVIVELNLPSYRMQAAQQRQGSPGDGTASLPEASPASGDSSAREEPVAEAASEGAA